MPYVAVNDRNNVRAPVGKWVCTRTSVLEPSATHPSADTRGNPNYCGQCVSYVTTVCPSLPVGTVTWRKGAQVRGNKALADGTVIATFDAMGRYHGHAAIYVRQDQVGIHVYDQWITGAGKSIGPRLIKWNGNGISNNGSGFHVVEH